MIPCFVIRRRRHGCASGSLHTDVILVVLHPSVLVLLLLLMHTISLCLVLGNVVGTVRLIRSSLAFVSYSLGVLLAPSTCIPLVTLCSFHYTSARPVHVCLFFGVTTMDSYSWDSLLWGCFGGSSVFPWR